MEDRPDNVKPIRRVDKAARSGDRRELLLALRDRLMWALDHGPQGTAEDMGAIRVELDRVNADLTVLDGSPTD